MLALLFALSTVLNFFLCRYIQTQMKKKPPGRVTAVDLVHFEETYLMILMSFVLALIFILNIFEIQLSYSLADFLSNLAGKNEHNVHHNFIIAQF